MVVFCGGSEKSTLKKARKYLSLGDYDNAKAEYNKLLTISGQNPEYLFETGVSYYNSGVEKEKSLGLFKAALQNSTKDTVPELLFYMGKIYHYVHEFSKAIEMYNAFRKYTSTNPNGLALQQEVNRLIEMSNNGITEFEKLNKKIEVENLDNPVNSTFSEYAPVFKQDESILLYTARRLSNTGSKFYHDHYKFEDIYISQKTEKGWTYPTKFDSSGIYISSGVNSKFHDAAITYNKTEDKLFIYKEKDVWQCELKDGVWSEPIRMNTNINSSGHEPSVYITQDQKTLFFVSNRKEGLGGRDIWVSKAADDGTWGQAENIGPVINTEFDDDAPYVTADGKTFYFSSQGHNTIGGYDIFRSALGEDGKWKAPENLGMPINSASDDIYYMLSEDQTFAYLSSSRAYGSGNMDIYRVQLDCKNIPNTEIRGILLVSDKRIPSGGTITIRDKESGEAYGPYTVDAKTGKFMLILPPERTYLMEIEVDKFKAERPHMQEFTIPKQCEFYQLFQEINVGRYRDTANELLTHQKALFRNALFDIKNESKKTYDMDVLNQELPDQYIPDLTFTPVSITGTIKHNEIQPAKNVEIYLVDKNKQIVKISRSDEKGNFSFSGLNPEDHYAVLIKENDLKLSYYGDAINNLNREVMVKGVLEKLQPENNALIPMPETDVVVIDNNIKSVNSTKTNETGNFSMSSLIPEGQEIDPLYANQTFPFKIDMNDVDQVFSAFIRTIRPGDSLGYVENIDIIDILNSPELLGFENIYFDFDKFFLRVRSKEILDKLGDYLVSHPDVTIDISGHCDWMGTDQYNVKLSQRRSISAFEYLAVKGVDSKRMKQFWYGENRPAASNTKVDGTDDPNGRQLNRRAEFRINIPNTAEITLHY
ncbi:MAG: OmpA family protein [Flavobacteriales bacterium]